MTEEEKKFYNELSDEITLLSSIYKKLNISKLTALKLMKILEETEYIKSTPTNKLMADTDYRIIKIKNETPQIINNGIIQQGNGNNANQDFSLNKTDTIKQIIHPHPKPNKKITMEGWVMIILAIITLIVMIVIA